MHYGSILFWQTKKLRGKCRDSSRVAVSWGTLEISRRARKNLRTYRGLSSSRHKQTLDVRVAALGGSIERAVNRPHVFKLLELFARIGKT